MSLTIHTRTSGNIEILTLAGRLTLGDGCSALRELIRGMQGSVLVDLSGVGYIDSAGLGELVSSLTTINSRGHAMKLLRPGKRVDSMLHITKLYSTFEVFEDETAAVESFK